MENQNKKNIPAQPEFSGESSLEYNMGEKDSKQKNRVKEILEYAESLTLVFAVMLLIFTFIARPATVDGTSMLPTLEDSSHFFGNIFFLESGDDLPVVQSAGRNFRTPIGVESDIIVVTVVTVFH